MTEPSLPEKVVSIHSCLDGAGIGHAFGGALALAYYAEPRVTIDVDVNVFVAPTQHPAVQAQLAPLGVGDEVPPAVVERDGQCRLSWGATPVDLFYAYHDLHDAMRRAARTVPFGEDAIPILAPEHLLVCKVIFNRPKDWIDVEQMLVAVPDLGREEIHGWLEEILDADDPRVVRLADLARELL